MLSPLAYCVISVWQAAA